MTNLEFQIECKVERMTDRIDARYMRGDLTTEQYREEMRVLNEWADLQYDKALALRGSSIDQ